MNRKMKTQRIVILVLCLAQMTGCKDPIGSIIQPDSVTPVNSIELSDELGESSGLMAWNGLLWTHNDDQDTRLFGLEVSSGELARVIDLPGKDNIDWESISQDEDWIYIGDFGNNTGSRADLHILRVEKRSFDKPNPVIDTIWFSFSNQLSMEPVESGSTDFDCEAFIVANDRIYLFTKQWLSKGTSIYTLPVIPGTYVAMLKDSIDIGGMITGASYHEPTGRLVLCGYSSQLQPFFYLLYDFEGHDFFSGKGKRISITLPYHQVEGVATEDGQVFYTSNERFGIGGGIEITQKLHTFDLGPWFD